MCHFHKPCSCLYPTQLSPPTEYIRPRHGHGRNYVVCKNCAEKKRDRQTKDFFLSLSRDKRGETISRHLLTVLPRFFPPRIQRRRRMFFFLQRRFSPSPSSVIFFIHATFCLCHVFTCKREQEAKNFAKRYTQKCI